MPSLTHPRARRRGRLAARACLFGLLPLSAFLASCSTAPPTQNGASGNTASNAPTGGDTTANTPGNGPGGGSASAGLFEQPRKADGELLIQIVTNGISPFWDPMAAGMKKAASELGCRAEWTGPRDATVTEQKRIVEDALAKGADGLALSCIDAGSAAPVINNVLSKKVPCITFDSDSPKSDRLAYIGTNNFNAGKAAGEAAVKLFPNGAKLMGFVGNISAENARERRDGFVEATKGHNIELIDVLDDNKDPARARRNVEDTMAKHGADVQGFLGLFSYNGPAIVQAVTNAGKRAQYKIIAFDAEPVTLQQLEKGNIDATVVQKPYDFGYLSTKLLYHVNRKGWAEARKEMNIPENGVFDTGVEVITPTNVKEYRQRLEKLGVKSS